MAEVLGNEAFGSFTGEIGGGFCGEIGVPKAGLGNKEAAGCFTVEIGDTEASWIEAFGSFTGEIGVTKAGTWNKDAASGFCGEIGVTKAGLGNKEAAGCFTGEIGGTKAEASAMVTEQSWIDYVILNEKEQPRLAPKRGRAEPTEAMITKEKVPDSFIDILINRRPFKKQPPLTDAYSKLLSKYDPELRELLLIDIARRNCCVDLHVDVQRQYKVRGFAEVGVDFTGGVKKIFVLP